MAQKKIETLFKRFNELLLAITDKSSYIRKKYAKELLEGLYQEILLMQNRIDKLTDIQPDVYHDNLFKTIRLLQLFGITQVDFDLYEKEFIEWLIERQDSTNKNFTLEQITNFRRLYGLYKMNYNKPPKKLLDLKKLINEFELSGYDSTT